MAVNIDYKKNLSFYFYIKTMAVNRIYEKCIKEGKSPQIEIASYLLDELEKS